MSDLSITNDSKNALSITNTSKPSSGTWSSTPGRTWADGGTWGEPGLSLTRDSKNALSISNEAKN